MGFTVRFFIGTVLVLLCFWATETAELSQQATKEPTVKNETEVSTVANLTIPKTDSEEENVDKQNNVVAKLQKSESSAKASQPETARSIDIDKYVSKEFHSKNNVYSLPISPDTQKYIDPDYGSSSTPKHDFPEKYDFEAELTTPRSHIFDDRYKEAVESVDQKLEHIDDSHEVSSESESKESVTLEKLLEETKKNDTKADLSYVNYKNIVNNDTAGKNSLHKDTVVEDVTNLNFRSEFNHTTIIDEDDSGNNTIVKPSEEKVEVTTLSNVIPIKGDLDNAESSTAKTIVLTTRKSSITKPPTNRNSIISNNIETETVKPVSDDALKVLPITEKLRGQPEIAPNLTQNDNIIKIVKRPFTLSNEATTTKVDKNDIQKKSEQQLQENQIIPIQVESPIDLKNNTKSALPESTTISEKIAANNTTIKQDLQTSAIIATTAATTTTTEKKLSNITISTTKIPETESTTLLPESVNNSSKNESEAVTNFWNDTDVETVTSIVTQTSVSIQITTQQPKNEPKVMTFPKFEVETTTELETTTNFVETESTTATTFLSDSTAATTENITTMKPESTTEENTTELFTTTQNELRNVSSTTETSVRSSKGLTYEETTTSILETTTEVATSEPFFTETTYFEATEPKTEEITTQFVTEGRLETRIVPELKNVPTDLPIEEVTTDNHTMTSQYYDNGDEDNSGVIAAIAISSVAALCLIVVVGLLVIMRKRQKRFNYGQRCRPVSLDDYSMDNVSVYNSVRRKGMARGSKRSYGNPAFEDPTSVSHPLNFPALGKFANNLEDMKAEYEEIPQITAKMNELPEGCDTKNRYANVIPLPETRVFLTSIEGYPNSDYINANYVTGPKNTKGYYIACQAPMQSTVDDFWRMVWEQQCKVILMLTHLFENGVEKCVDYLPPSEVLDCHRLFGDFQVTLKKREVKDKYIISSLQLKNMVSNSWREVTHFWYLGWPEKGVPSEANSLIAFLIEARSYMKSSSLDRKDATNGNLNNGMSKNEINPVVVHCSPGTGRTGVVIACDIAIREFEQNRLVDIPRIVYRIRRDRASAVQTKEQYIFIYKVVSLYATKLTGGALDSL